MSCIRNRKALDRAGRAIALATTLSLGACAQVGDLGLNMGLGSSEPDQVAAEAATSRPVTELEKATAYWGEQVAKTPRDGKAVLNYARNLKALGRKPEALAALQAGYIFNGENPEYLSEYGRLALDLGQTNLAGQLLERADDPAKPDWKVVSARGTALAKNGQYKEALAFFERAHELSPNQASVLNNLAMAYTLDGQADRAEDLLRRAQAGSSDPRVKQNLVLVLGLKGKSDEARSLSGGGASDPDLPIVKASAAGTAPPASKAVDSARMVAPASPVTATPLEPDEIVKAALKAEAAKVKTATLSTKRRTASADDAPALRPTTR